MLTIIAVRTLSEDISSSGGAVLDTQASTATITISASDNPHGVMEFQATSASGTETAQAQLTLIRQFGIIGKTDHTYLVIMVAIYRIVGVAKRLSLF